MKRKKLFLTIAVVLFISVNIFLVVKDTTGKVDRIAYIKNWTETETKDMYDLLETDCVLDYMDEQLVYLDEYAGSFQEFLIEQGDSVAVGQDLYTYKVENYYEMKEMLDNEVELLNDEVVAIETAISKMKEQNIQQNSTRFVYPDDSEAGTITQNTSEAEMMKEQFIIEKEKELEQKNAQLVSVEAQVQDLTAGEDTIAVTSPFSGRVTDISVTLDNPIMTIETPILHVKSELTEKERMKVEEAMLVNIHLVEEELEDVEELTGFVSKLSDEPKNIVLKGESIYPFHVTLDDEIEQDQLLQGYHAHLEVTLEESIGAVVVSENLVRGTKVWNMTRRGTLLNQEVDTGIHMDGFVEVTETFKNQDWIAVADEEKFHDDATFITPLKPSKAKWKDIYKNGPRKRSFLIGLLGR